MESKIELAEKYNRLLKEQNQFLKDAIRREDDFAELNKKYVSVSAKADIYEETLKNISTSLCPINESEYRSWHNDTRQAATEALSAEEGEKEANNG
jgi:recombinational DNA repair ATPase RecF